MFLSHEDRSNLLVSLAMLCQAVSEYLPCCTTLSSLCASPTVLLRYAKKEYNRKQHVAPGSPNSSSGSGLNISDYECEESERISNFSFDSRMMESGV